MGKLFSALGFTKRGAAVVAVLFLAIGSGLGFAAVEWLPAYIDERVNAALEERAKTQPAPLTMEMVSERVTAVKTEVDLSITEIRTRMTETETGVNNKLNGVNMNLRELFAGRKKPVHPIEIVAAAEDPNLSLDPAASPFAADGNSAPTASNESAHDPAPEAAPKKRTPASTKAVAKTGAKATSKASGKGKKKPTRL